jgi:hypothetical protein
MLKFVYNNFYKKFKEGDLAITPKKNVQLIKFFREQFYKNIREFRFSINDVGTFTTFPNHSFILFAIQIRSLFASVNHLQRVKLLYSLAAIFTGFAPHREENDPYKEHAAGQLPHNHIFFELVVVACGSMIDTFCQHGYLKASKHKTGAKEIQVSAGFRDADQLMIIPTLKDLVGGSRPGSTTICPDLGVAGNRKRLSLLQPKTQPLSMRTRSNTKPPPTIDVTERSARVKKRRSYSKNDDDDEEQVKSRSSKQRKNNNKHDYQDEDEEYEDKDDDAKGNDESNGENNQRGYKSDKSKWPGRYQDDSFWPDNRRYNLKEWEFKDKEKWTTPAACMDNEQRKNLVQTIKTW